MLISKENKRALDNLNDKLLEILNHGGPVASYFLSTPSEILNPENTS